MEGVSYSTQRVVSWEDANMSPATTESDCTPSPVRPVPLARLHFTHDGHREASCDKSPSESQLVSHDS